MKIERIGDSYFTHGLIDCKLYVRKDLTVVKVRNGSMFMWGTIPICP